MVILVIIVTLHVEEYRIIWSTCLSYQYNTFLTLIKIKIIKHGFRSREGKLNSIGE
jgi:hypothetical protein